MQGHASPTRSLRLPVKFAEIRAMPLGVCGAFQAMTASTANSGSVWSQARMARARPCEIRNWAASAPHAIRSAARTIDGNVQSAEEAEAAGAPSTKLRLDRATFEMSLNPSEPP